MTDSSSGAGAARNSLPVRPVTYGKLVQRPNGPVVAGVEHAITSYADGMPPDVPDACRPELLVPAEANPLQMVEPWAHERGALFIVPLQRPGYDRHAGLWCIAGRVRPYPERGPGQGGRPATLVTAWPMPAAEWASVAPRLVPAMADQLVAEPELDATPRSARFKREPRAIAVAPLEDTPVAGIRVEAMVMIEGLRQGRRSRWDATTFATEADFLACLSIVYGLIPLLGDRALEARALLSASSGLAIGAESFEISYTQSAATPARAKPKLEVPESWRRLIDASPDLTIGKLAERARSHMGRRLWLPETDGLRFGHAGRQGDWWAADALAGTLGFYARPDQQTGFDRMRSAIRSDGRAAGEWRQPQPENRPRRREPQPYDLPYTDDEPPTFPYTDADSQPARRSGRQSGPEPYLDKVPTQRAGRVPLEPTDRAETRDAPRQHNPRPGHLGGATTDGVQVVRSGFATEGGPQSTTRGPVGAGSRPVTAGSWTNAVALKSDPDLHTAAAVLERNANNVGNTADHIVGCLEAACRLASPAEAPRLQRLEAGLDPRFLRQLRVLGGLHSGALANAARPLALADIEPLLTLLEPARAKSGDGRDLVRRSRDYLMAEGRAAVLDLGILDDAELELILGRVHMFDLEFDKMYESVAHADPGTRDRVADLWHKSLVLQAWRPDARSWDHLPDKARTPRQHVTHYADRWRQREFEAHGKHPDPALIRDAILSLLSRAERGHVPVLEITGLRRLVPWLKSGGHDRQLLTEIDAVEARRAGAVDCLRLCRELKNILY